VDTLLSMALLDAGEPIKAVEVLQAVVAKGAPARVCRTILDAGPEIGVLLTQLKENVERKPKSKDLVLYVDGLLEHWRMQYRPTAVEGTNTAMAGSVTSRERGILELIAQGRSNKDIARSLGVAPETVKTHLKNIFKKLSVKTRAHAIARAQSLGLVKTP